MKVLTKSVLLLLPIILSCSAPEDQDDSLGDDSEGDSEAGDSDGASEPFPGATAPDPQTGGQDVNPITLSLLPGCGSNNHLFSVSPVIDSDLKGLVPLGNLNPSSHTFPTDHLYFYLTEAQTPVHSPGDATLLMVITKDYLNADPPYSDYDLYFYPCREFQVKFAHLVTLSEDLKAQIASAGSGSCTEVTSGGYEIRYCNHAVNIHLAAGEILGTAGLPTQSLFAFDFGAIDGRVTPLAYANPDRYFEAADHLDALHTVCPINYFEEALKSRLSARFGNYLGNIPRTAEPLCGEIEQDIPGTAQGKWYVEGTPKERSSQEDLHLALVHDNIDPTKPAFSVGSSVTNLAAGAYAFTPTNSGSVNRNFGGVASDGSVYCYEAFRSLFDERVSIPMTLLVQMPSETTLRIEWRNVNTCGSGPWAFSGTAVDFER